MPAFTAEDLSLGTDVLDQLTSACANAGIPNPIESAIEAAVGMVDDYTTQYALTDLRYKRLVRALAVYEMYRLAGGGVPEAIAEANKTALTELKEIRDGKFTDLAQKVLGEGPGEITQAKSTHGSKWGGEDRISMRG